MHIANYEEKRGPTVSEVLDAAKKFSGRGCKETINSIQECIDISNNLLLVKGYDKLLVPAGICKKQDLPSFEKIAFKSTIAALVSRHESNLGLSTRSWPRNTRLHLHDPSSPAAGTFHVAHCTADVAQRNTQNFSITLQDLMCFYNSYVESGINTNAYSNHRDQHLYPAIVFCQLVRTDKLLKYKDGSPRGFKHISVYPLIIYFDAVPRQITWQMMREASLNHTTAEHWMWCLSLKTIMHKRIPSEIFWSRDGNALLSAIKDIPDELMDSLCRKFFIRVLSNVAMRIKNFEHLYMDGTGSAVAMQFMAVEDRFEAVDHLCFLLTAACVLAAAGGRRSSGRRRRILWGDDDDDATTRGNNLHLFAKLPLDVFRRIRMHFRRMWLLDAHSEVVRTDRRLQFDLMSHWTFI